MKRTWRAVGLLDCLIVLPWFNTYDHFIISELHALFLICTSRCLKLSNDTETQDWPSCNATGICSTCAYNLWIMKTERITQFIGSLFFWDIEPLHWVSGSDVSRQRIGLISGVELSEKHLSWILPCVSCPTTRRHVPGTLTLWRLTTHIGVVPHR